MKKKLIAVAVTVIIVLCDIAFENWEKEQLERCVNAGYTKEYCSVKLGG